MGYESGPKPAREMDASAFGNMIHKTLENFGLESIGDGRRMLEYTEQHIRERVQALLIEEARAHFGTNPTLPLRCSYQTRAPDFIHSPVFKQIALLRDGKS